MRRFHVDARLCIGCGLCEERAPGNLEVSVGVGAAQLIRQPASEAELIAVGQAADYCPSGALARVEDVARARRKDDDNRRNYESGPHAVEV
jgi:ferredoxin